MEFPIEALVFVLLMVVVIGLHPPGYAPQKAQKPPQKPPETPPPAETNKKPPAGKPQEHKPKA